MSAKHGDPLRGLMSTARSPLFDGKFGRLFRSLPPATFGISEADNIANLTKLGAAMSSEADPADPKVGKDDEESGIPALYTYLGQFIDHDLTFDPASSLQKQNDPGALVDFRSPAFDLDNVYGRGPADQPYLYNDGNSFWLGDTLHGGSDPQARDLPRNTPPSLAARNLLRGWRLELPSGQRVAHRMKVAPLADADILIDKAVEQADQPLPNILSVSPVFKNNCPLWTYILAEAMHHKEAVKIPVNEDVTINTPRLGPVGGRIVAEVFLGLMFNDKHSLLTLQPNWEPPSGSQYALKDFVRYALGL